MLQLELQVNQMLPLIDTELERVDRKHAQLTQLSSDLVEAINLYHTLMREPDRSVSAYMGYAGAGQSHMRPHGSMPTHVNGMYAMPPSMYHMPSNVMPPTSLAPAMHGIMMGRRKALTGSLVCVELTTFMRFF